MASEFSPPLIAAVATRVVEALREGDPVVEELLDVLDGAVGEGRTRVVVPDVATPSSSWIMSVASSTWAVSVRTMWSSMNIAWMSGSTISISAIRSSGLMILLVRRRRRSLLPGVVVPDQVELALGLVESPLGRVDAIGQSIVMGTMACLAAAKPSGRARRTAAAVAAAPRVRAALPEAVDVPAVPGTVASAWLALRCCRAPRFITVMCSSRRTCAAGKTIIRR